MNAAPPVPLVESRQAAVARLAYAVEKPGTVALLCGPAGTGKTLVLERLVAAVVQADRAAEVRRLREWAEGSMSTAVPSVVVVDDAHECDAAALVDVVDRCRARRPDVSLVFAGQGRLLSIVARDSRLERAVRLRAVLRPFAPAESRAVLDALLFPRLGLEHDEELRAVLAVTIHEIAAGIPAAVERLADLAVVVAAGRPDRRLDPADVEAIHRRLCLTAA